MRVDAIRGLFSPSTRGASSREARDRSPSPPALLWRAARIVALVLYGLYLAYLLVANAFLSAPWLRGIASRDPSTLLLEYDRAYTLVPFSVHARNVRVRSADRTVQWEVRIEKLATTIRPLRLFEKEIAFARVEGDGVRFRARLRRMPSDVESPWVAMLPPIAGLDDPPRVPAGPPAPPETAEDYSLWSVRLDDVRAENVQEIWIDTVRTEGAATVSGSFALMPRLMARVGPASWELHRVDVMQGGDAWLTGAHGRVDVRIDPFDATLSPLRVLRFASVRADVAGDIPNLRALAAHLGKDVGLEGAGGTLRVDARMDHGVVEPGSQVDVELARVSVRTRAKPGAEPLVANFDVRARARVDAARTPSLAVDAERTTITQGTTTLLSVRTPALRVGSTTLDLASPTSLPWRWEAKVDEARATDVGALLRSVSTFAALRGGTLTARGELAGDASWAPRRGAITFDARDLAYAADGDARASADVAGDVRFDRDGEGTRLERADVRLRNGRVGTRGSASPSVTGYWADLHARGVLPKGTSGGPAMSLDTEVRARDLDPLFELLGPLQGFPKTAHDVLSVDNWRGTAHVDVGPGGVRIEGARARAENVEVRGFFRKPTPGEPHLALLVAVPVVTVGIERRGDDTSVKLFGAQRWFEELASARRARP
jgi:hypothetical protein